MSAAGCTSSEAAWNDIQQQQNKKDKQEDSENAAGSIPPFTAVTPCGQATDQEQHEDDEKDEAHVKLLQR
jgi:hypothetical protein